jgi:hypothetical protein
MMQDVYQVLREKENGLEQVRREIQALQLAAQLLEEPDPVSELRARNSDPLANQEEREASKISTRLKRITAPLLGTFAR